MFIEKGAFIRPLPLVVYTTLVSIWLFPGILSWATALVSDYALHSSVGSVVVVSALYYRHKRRRDDYNPITPSDLHRLEEGEFEHAAAPPSSPLPTPSPPPSPQYPALASISHSTHSNSSPLSRRLKKAADVKALTYNLYLRPPLVHSNEDDYKDERLKEFMKLIPDFDIICLQEVFSLGTSRQARIIQAARKHHYYHVHSKPPHLMSLKFVDAGLVILSRYPIVETDGYIFKAGHQIDSYAAKQVLYAKVQLSASQFLHVFTTHMQATYYDNEPHLNVLNDSARRTQIDEMVEFALTKKRRSPADESTPILFTGDFNLPARAQPDNDTIESTDYINMMQTLNASFQGHDCVDLLKESSNGTHPLTYGDVIVAADGSIRPKETVLTCKPDWNCQLTIDYLLWVAPTTSQTTPSKSPALSRRNGSPLGLTFKPNAARVEQFPITGYPFQQLSDHYGAWASRGFAGWYPSAEFSPLCEGLFHSTNEIDDNRRGGRGAATSGDHYSPPRAQHPTNHAHYSSVVLL